MNNELKRLLGQLTHAYFEGEGEGEGEGEEQNNASGDQAKTFTQEEVNTLLAKNRRTLQVELSATKTQLEELRKNTSLSTQERTDLEARIDSLNAALMSKEELTKREKERLKAEMDTKLSTAEKQAEEWRNLHFNTLIENQLIAASTIEGQRAFNPRQIVELFKSKAQVVEDPANPKSFNVILKIDLPDAQGKVKQLELTPTAAMKELAALPEYANLFNIDTKTGLGRTKPKFSTQKGALPTSMADYKEARKDILG